MKFLDSGGVDNIGLLFLVVGAPFIAATYVSICERRYDSIIKEDVKLFKKEEDMEMYILILIGLIKNKRKIIFHFMFDFFFLNFHR